MSASDTKVILIDDADGPVEPGAIIPCAPAGAAFYHARPAPAGSLPAGGPAGAAFYHARPAPVGGIPTGPACKADPEPAAGAGS